MNRPVSKVRHRELLSEPGRYWRGLATATVSLTHDRRSNSTSRGLRTDNLACATVDLPGKSRGGHGSGVVLSALNRPGMPWNRGPASRGIVGRHAVESALLRRHQDARVPDGAPTTSFGQKGARSSELEELLLHCCRLLPLRQFACSLTVGADEYRIELQWVLRRLGVFIVAWTTGPATVLIPD